MKLDPHAFVVVDDQGHGVLVHLGINTVQLNGEGFELLVDKGDTVQRGQATGRWDPAGIHDPQPRGAGPDAASEPQPVGPAQPFGAAGRPPKAC